MHQTQKDKGHNSNNSLFKKPTVDILIDKEQWSYLQKRYHMTPRELQVARLVCDGFSTKEITKALKIKERTVITHLRNVYIKLRIKCKVTLLLKCLEDVNSFYVQSKASLPQVPIVDIEIPRKRTAVPTETPKKER
jgi:DNA-binding CsgD family transcriptional regulator